MENRISDTSANLMSVSAYRKYLRGIQNTGSHNGLAMTAKGEGKVKTTEMPKLDPAVEKALIYDLEHHPVRQLSKEERDIYGNAVAQAVSFIPAFRDVIALLHPFMDATAPTAYTDQYSRMGLSYWFFHLTTRDQRASVILHETMHVLNNHFARFEDLGINAFKGNIVGDFEINTSLDRVNFVDLSIGIFPDKDPYSLPPRRTMEWYAQNMKPEDYPEEPERRKKDSQQGKGQGGDSPEKQVWPPQKPEDGAGSGDEDGDEEGSGSGQPGQPGSGEGEQEGSSSGSNPSEDHSDEQEKGIGCGHADDDTIQAADDAGIDRASDVEIDQAKKNAAARIREEKHRSTQMGSGHMNEFFDSVLKHLTPPKVDWRSIFRRVISTSFDSIVKGRSDYSYRRISRRLSSDKFIFPGMVKYNPTVMLGIDTSGSMANSDYEKALSEIEGLLRAVAKGNDAVTIFSVDTQIGNITPVTSVKKVNLMGGGGTQMAVAFRYVTDLGKKRPDVFVLSTDGYIDWADVYAEVRRSKNLYKSIILVTTPGGYQSAPEALRKLIPVIDISDNKD